LIICATPSATKLSAMALQRPPSRWTRKYPLGGPAEWLADGHVTCNIQCSAGKCDRRMVDVRLDPLPQDLPWSTISRRLVCKQCGAAGPVHIVPNWHARTSAPVPFTRHWKDPALKLTADRPFADPDKAARRLLEHAHAFEPNSGWPDLYREAQRSLPVRRQGLAC